MNYNNKRTLFFNERFRYKSDTNPFKLTLGSKKEFEAFFKAASLKKGMKLIDLGCGNGRYVLPLLKKGYFVTGVDLADDALEALKKKARQYHIQKNLQVIRSDFHTLPHDLKDKFDRAYIISTLHMVSKDKKVRRKIFSNLVQTLKKGGQVIVLESNPLNPLFYPFYLFSPTVDWEIEKTFLSSNRWEVTSLMKEVGLSNIRVIPYGFLPGLVMDKLPFIQYINQIACSLPVVNYFSTFNFFVGEKI